MATKKTPVKKTPEKKNPAADKQEKEYVKRATTKEGVAKGPDKITTPVRKDEDFLHPEAEGVLAVISGIQIFEGVKTQYGLKDRLLITFQTEVIRVPENGEPWDVGIFVNNVLSPRSALGELVDKYHPWEEVLQMDEVDIQELLIGTHWILSVAHYYDQSTNKTYANVTERMKAPSRSKKLTIFHHPNLPF